MQNTVRRNQIIIAIVGFILGFALSSAASMHRGPNMMFKGDMNREGGKMMMQHRMPDGSMMDGSMKRGMENMMDGMVGNLKGKTGKDLEKAFLTDMIPHHQGAVEMAKLLVVDPTVSAELRAFAQQIITAQEGEIEKMNMWVKNY